MPNLLIHATPKSIINAYHSDKNHSDYVKGEIKKSGCWGFIAELETIHIYYNKKATKQDLLDLFAHELSHTNYDALNKKTEEDFCCSNAALCVQAYKLMRKITQ